MSNELKISGKLVLLGGNPITLPIAASNPGSAVSGDLYYNSTDNTVHYYNGSAWISIGTVSLTGQVLTTGSIIVGVSGLSAQSDTISQGDILASASGLTIKSGVITNSEINASAAIAYSKLALSNSIVNADINTSAAIAYSKLALSNSIVNADINASAAIAYSKLALSNSIVNADIASGAAIAFSKLAALNSANILVGNGSNVATSVAMSGEATISNAGAVTLSNAAVIGKVLTGYVSGAGTITAADTILSAIEKLNGNATGTFANVTLSNLTSPTAINQDLNFDTGGDAYLRTKNDSIATKALYVTTGDSTGDNTAGLFLRTGSTSGASAISGDVYIQTGDTASGTPGGMNFLGGTAADGSNSGGFQFVTASASAGNSGNILFQTGAASGIKGSVISSANLLPDGDVVFNLGSASARWQDLYAASARDGSSLESINFGSRQLKFDNSTVMLDWNTAGTINVGTNLLSNLADPVSGQDAVTLAYMNARLQGLKPKESARVASTANIVIASALVNGAVVDGVTLATGDRVLLKNQTAPAQNGIYIVAASGAASRSSDFDSLSPIDEINGAWVAIQEGTVAAGTVFVQYGLVATLGTDAINFEYFNPIAGLIGGDMITFTGSTFSVDLASSSGLESTNPGNVAGQLRVKLEATNPSLKFTGSNELAVKLNAAGAITSGASGLIVGVDNSTIEINSNALRVKAGGITNNEVSASAAIAYSKLALSNSIVNADVASAAAIAYSKLALSNSIVNADIASAAAIAYTKLAALTANVIPSTNASGFLQSSSSVAETLVSSAFNRGLSTSNVISEMYIDASTLTDNSGPTAVTAFQFAAASFAGEEICYVIENGASPSLTRIGTLRIVCASDGTNPSINDMYTETADCGVSWTATNSAGTISVKYTTSNQGSDRNMRADCKQFRR